MKKLMIAAAIVCAAAVVEAASFKWKTGMDEGVSFPGGSTWVSGNAYLFAASTDGDGATLAQSVIVDAFAAGTLDLSKKAYLDIGEADTGDIAANSDPFDYGAAGDATQFYFAMMAKDSKGNDMLYISTLAEGIGQSGTKKTTMAFEESAASAAEALSANDGYAGAGWYSVESVPEPFSGALALLGMGAIALRRKMKKVKKA